MLQFFKLVRLKFFLPRLVVPDHSPKNWIWSFLEKMQYNVYTLPIQSIKALFIVICQMLKMLFS